MTACRWIRFAAPTSHRGIRNGRSFLAGAVPIAVSRLREIRPNQLSVIAISCTAADCDRKRSHTPLDAKPIEFPIRGKGKIRFAVDLAVAAVSSLTLEQRYLISGKTRK